MMNRNAFRLMFALVLGTTVGSSALAGSLLVNGDFNEPEPAYPPGTVVSYSDICDQAGDSAAARWRVYVYCVGSVGAISTQLVPSTLQGSDGYMIHVRTNENLSGLFQNDTFAESNVLTSTWVYINSGCVGIGSGNGASTVYTQVTCETGRWLQMSGAPNSQSPANETIIYAADYLGCQGADFFVKNASVVAVNQCTGPIF